MVAELLHHARKVPSLPLSRRVNVRELAELRRDAGRPSWLGIFMKAYGLVARRYSELRRAWIPYPWPRLYEHPFSEPAVLVEREWQGEQVVLAGTLRAPEDKSLGEIDEVLRWFRDTPVWEVGSYRQILRLGRLPWLLRRFAFWSTLYFSGYTRAKRFGTFMMSSLGNFGVEQHHPLTPLTTYFTYGPISRRGRVTAKIIYDHRVMDGRTVARCLQELEETLNGPLVSELRELAVLGPEERSAERQARSAKRGAPSAERGAPSAKRGAPSAERQAPSAERSAPARRLGS
jgi:hypothetical protein